MTSFNKFLIWNPETGRFLRCDRGAYDLRWTPQVRRASSFLFREDALLNLKLARFDTPGAKLIKAKFTIEAKLKDVSVEPEFDTARQRLADNDIDI